jgi:membrane protein
LIGIYLRNFGASSVTGAAGAVALVLVWMYYEAQIVLAGAEFTRVLAIGAGTLSAQLAPPKVDTT